MHIRTRLMLSAGILIALPVFTRGQQKIEPEILESWKRYKAKLSHAQGEYSGTSKRRHGTDSSVGNVEVKFAFTSGCQRVELVETETGTVKPSRQLICRNPKYSFRLDLRENGWLLREVVMAGEEPSSVRDSLHDKLDAWLACLNCLNAIERTQLLDLADDLRWTEPQEGQTKALNLIKERRLKSGPNTITYHKLSLQLNADHYHTLQSARAEWLMNKTEGILEITASQQMNGGIPVPTRLVSRQTYPTIPGGDLEITTDTSFRIDPSVELPDQDFTLTAYGLPEPVGITWSKPTPNYVWPCRGRRVRSTCPWVPLPGPTAGSGGHLVRRSHVSRHLAALLPCCLRAADMGRLQGLAHDQSFDDKIKTAKIFAMPLDSE